MQRQTYPQIGGFRPTGRRLDKSECETCGWEFETASGILDECKKHVEATSHTIYTYRAIEYVLTPRPPETDQRI